MSRGREWVQSVGGNKVGEEPFIGFPQICALITDESQIKCLSICFYSFYTFLHLDWRIFSI